MGKGSAFDNRVIVSFHLSLSENTETVTAFGAMVIAIALSVGMGMGTFSWNSMGILIFVEGAIENMKAIENVAGAHDCSS